MAAAALTNERALCVARVVFLAALLVRFHVVASVGAAAALITTLPLLFGIGFSLAVLWLIRQPPVGEGLQLASVALDAAVVFLNLLPNALWPTASYPGALATPDSAAVFLATVAAGLRLSPRAAVLATALNGAGVLGLVTADRWISGSRFVTGVATVSLYLLLLVGFGMVAAILADASRRLAIRGATAAVRAEAARHSLRSVLEDHHDLRSLLTSAVVRAETLARQPLDATGEERSGGVRRTAEQLSEDLDHIRQIVDEVKARALMSLDDRVRVQAVALEPAVECAIDRSRTCFPEVSFAHVGQDDHAEVAVGGGQIALSAELRPD